MTCWVFGGGGFLIVAAALKLVQTHIVRLFSSPGGSAVYWVAIAATCVYELVVVVATWRSAGNYERSGVYGVLAKTAAVLALLGVLRLLPVVRIDQYLLQQIASAASAELPGKPENGVRADSVVADGMTLTFKYTYTGSPASAKSSTERFAWNSPNVRSTGCKRMQRYLEAGVTIAYEYFGNDGAEVGTLSIDRDRCTDLRADGSR